MFCVGTQRPMMPTEDGHNLEPKKTLITNILSSWCLLAYRVYKLRARSAAA
jgi:hypothetical protein